MLFVCECKSYGKGKYIGGTCWTAKRIFGFVEVSNVRKCFLFNFIYKTIGTKMYVVIALIL